MCFRFYVIHNQNESTRIDIKCSDSHMHFYIEYKMQKLVKEKKNNVKLITRNLKRINYFYYQFKGKIGTGRRHTLNKHLLKI